MLTLRRYAALIAILLVVGAAAFFYWSRHRPPRRVQLTSNSPLNPVTSSAISPDGRVLAYSDRNGVHLKHIARGKAQTVISANTANAPMDWKVSAWFPDGRRFLANAVAPDGKATLWIGNTDGNAQLFVANALGWSVSPDGSEVAYPAGSESRYTKPH